MKKNRVMRFASMILILTLLSTSIISGTFAKYVTTNSGSDTARVAKFGVTIEIKDEGGTVVDPAQDLELFKTEYATEDTTYTGTLSVQSSSESRLVAPGTKGSLSITITGTPEVATRLKVEFDADDFEASNAIQLAAGTYTLGAGEYEADEKSVTTTAVYEPVKFYFGTTAITDATVYDLTLEALQDELEDAINADKAPNENLAATYYLGWCWPFEGTFTVGTENVADFLDTYLGNQETLQEQVLNFKISVTQID